MASASRASGGEPRWSRGQDAVLVLLSGIVIGCALGIGAAMLYVATDPNLSPHFGTFLQRSGPRMAASHAAAGALIAGVCVLLRGGAWSRRTARALAVFLPAFGTAISILASPAAPWTLDPKLAGTIVTTSDFHFLAAIAALTAATFYPLLRWATRLLEGRRKSGGWTAAGVGALCVAALLLTGHSGKPGAVASAGSSNSANPVVLIGIDGADWDEIHSLLKLRRLSVLGRLIDTGASGSLATFRPTLSPMIWNTVATGQPPCRHGIVNFLDAASKVPYTSNSRRVPALWTLLGQQGITVGVVGWWTTWPAEVVNGHMVSAYSNPDQETIKGTLYQGLDRQTYPPELIETVRPRIAAGVEWGKAELASILGGFDASSVDEFFAKRVRIGSFVLASDRIFTDAAVYIAETYRPRFLAVYLSAVDSNSHAFCASNPLRDLICGRVIDGVYAAVDREIGRILEAVGDEATVIIVSDHGFDRARGHEHGFLHGPPGIIIMNGGGIRPGGEISAASIYDVAPTILSIFGLPLAGDLRGRVLLSAFEASYVEGWRFAFGPSRTPSIDAGADQLRPIPSSSDEQLKERLRSLGYIE